MLRTDTLQNVSKNVRTFLPAHTPTPHTATAAVAIPGAGTVYFNPYRLSGRCGTLAAENGVLVAPDGGSQRLPAPVRGDDATISGDGWTFKAAPGWVIREGARRGDYEVVRQQP